MTIKFIQTADAPAPAGHYSQAVVHNGLVYVSGQLATDARTGERLLGSIEEQTGQVLKNIAEVLRAADSDLSRVLRMTIYITDIKLWGRFNLIFARVMGEHRPARAVVPVPALNHGFLVEIEAVAAVRDDE